MIQFDLVMGCGQPYEDPLRKGKLLAMVSLKNLLLGLYSYIWQLNNEYSER